MSRGCDDCGGGHGESYMLHDAVWLSVAPDDALLCIVCFEKRLGRRLVRADFTHDKCNLWFSAVPGPLQDRYQPTRDEMREGAKQLLRLMNARVTRQ